MPIAHLPSDVSPDEVAAVIGRDGAAVVDGAAPAALLDRIESELRPYLDATPTGPDDFSGSRTRRTGSLIARSPSCPRARHAPARPGHGAHLPRARHEHPAAPDASHRHRPRGDSAAHPPGPVGVRLLSLPAGLRGPVQHDLGADRIHRGERCHPGGAGEQRPGGQARVRSRRHRAGGDVARLGAVLLRQRVPRRGRQPLLHHPHRPEHHLQRGLAATGGEPIPLRAARGGRDAADGPASTDGVRPPARTRWAISTISAIR